MFEHISDYGFVKKREQAPCNVIAYKFSVIRQQVSTNNKITLS